MCALGHCTKQPSQSLANPSSTVGDPSGSKLSLGPARQAHLCKDKVGGRKSREVGAEDSQNLGEGPALRCHYYVTPGELFNLSGPQL